MSASEIPDKMRLVRELSDSIHRAKLTLAAHPSMYNALQIQDLEQRRRDLRATIPMLQLVPKD